MKDKTSQLLNVPNMLTGARLVLAILLFCLASFHMHLTAMILFLIAATTDWLDGYWARRFQQVTQFGRIFDPFVDKIIVCGAFIYLAAEPRSGILPWMAVLVVGRELLVTALRGFIEQHGGDFSASMSGKLKMVFQCAAVVASFGVLVFSADEVPVWLEWGLLVSVWLAIITTVYSGAAYVVAAAKFVRQTAAA